MVALILCWTPYYKCGEEPPPKIKNIVNTPYWNTQKILRPPPPPSSFLDSFLDNLTIYIRGLVCRLSCQSCEIWYVRNLYNTLSDIQLLTIRCHLFAPDKHLLPLITKIVNLSVSSDEMHLKEPRQKGTAWSWDFQSFPYSITPVIFIQISWESCGCAFQVTFLHAYL